MKQWAIVHVDMAPYMQMAPRGVFLKKVAKIEVAWVQSLVSS